MALLKLAALTEGLPVLTLESAEAELIAGELDKWAGVDTRKKVRRRTDTEGSTMWWLIVQHASQHDHMN